MSPCQSFGNHFIRLVQRTNEGFYCKINDQALGQLSGKAWAGLPVMGQHKHRVFQSLLQSLLAATLSLDENMLPLLQY